MSYISFVFFVNFHYVESNRSKLVDPNTIIIATEDIICRLNIYEKIELTFLDDKVEMSWNKDDQRKFFLLNITKI